MSSYRWTSRDLETLYQFEDWKLDKEWEQKGTFHEIHDLYEIIDGELHAEEHPALNHQAVMGELCFLLRTWSDQPQLGSAIFRLEVVFAEDDDVVPDVIWMSDAVLKSVQQSEDSHLHSTPELVVEILSPGSDNEQWTRVNKLNLYSRRGVLEYWIVSWQERFVEVYRREGETLKLIETLYEGDTLQSPHLPGFECRVKEFFRHCRQNS